MPSRFKLLIPVMLMVLLASAQNVFASIEIAYDDGTSIGSVGGVFTGVRFSLPSGVSKAQIRTVRFRWAAWPDNLRIHITGPDHVTELTSPILVTTTSASTGFQDVDVSARNIIVTGDFWVVLENLGGQGNAVQDAKRDYDRSFTGGSLAGLTTPTFYGDILIRAVIEPVGGVGGVVLPTNTLAVLVPYLAVIGLVATATVAVKKRRN